MNRRPGTVPAALLVVVAVLAGLAGCGVPRSGPAVVVRDAARGGAANDSTAVTRPSPDGVTDAQDLVGRYLRVAAGGNEVSQDQPDAMDKAVRWARKFMTDAAADSWQPGSEITVVRAVLNPAVPTPTGIRVQVILQPVGALDAKGIIEPRPGLPSQTWPFTVVPASRGGAGLRIANPPPGLLLSTDGLSSLYDVQPIYFWDSAQTELIPDLRYVSRFLLPANRLVEQISWLLGGPSDYLRQAVQPVPSAIKVKDRPVLEANAPAAAIRVNLVVSAASVQPSLSRFVTQLKWSVRPLAGPVELQIEGQNQDVQLPSNLITVNPAVPPDGQHDPPRFCVVGGQVRQLGGDPLAMPSLDADANNGVVSAGILGGAQPEVALVRTDGPGRVRLWLGAYERNTRLARYVGTDVAASTMSQPVGVATDDGPLFLVAADGRLMGVPVSGPAQDHTPPGVGPVTAVSVAPDGRRLAFVAGGRPYVAVLELDGAISVSQPVPVDAGLSDASGIAWSREEWVVVAGRLAAQTALVEVSLDSAMSDPLQLRNLSGLAVSRVVAQPVAHFDPPPGGDRGLIMLEAGDRVYRVYSESVELTTDTPAPVASPSPSPGAAKEPPPAAPFFPTG